VRNRGGSRDTVEGYDPENRDGTGLSSIARPETIFATVKKACEVYRVSPTREEAPTRG
jgi:glycogen synthase